MKSDNNIINIPCKSDDDCKIQSGGEINKFKIKYYQFGGYEKEKHPLSEWIYQEGYILNSDNKLVSEGPVHIYNYIVKQYGKPDVIANQPGGICIWYIDQRNGDSHHSIELRDSYIPHCVPAPHHDFLTSFVKVYVPSNKLKNILTISGSVSYDGLTKMLGARCASFEANLATLSTVMKELESTTSNYSDNIKNRYNSFKDNTRYVNEQILLNQKKYKKELKAPYYKGAFPDGCP